ncbi:MAG: chromosome segregation protein SMC, partial [Clostridia bacterium]|nr:chromosome segregation protein SMC [Clostridia bacterium]
TEQRKSMSYCEASLIFDNKNQIFPLPYDEVVISRKLYRSGESEYLINRAPARLRDISELLRNAGLGLEGYSIVGQGRMDAILNSKPDDRRAIFEEALGISNFRQKKKETERKLARNKDNMTRLFDITSELDRQLGPLKKQAEDAKKYLALSEQIKYNEVNSYIYNYDNAATFKAQINQKIKGINEELNYVGEKFRKAFDEYEESFRLREQLDLERDQLVEKQRELEVSMAKQSGETEVSIEKIRGLKKENERLSLQIDATNEQISQLNKKIAQSTEKKADMQLQYEALTIEFSRLNGEISKVLESISQIQSLNDQNQNEIMSILDSLTESRSQDANIRGELNTLVLRIGQIDSDVQNVKSKIQGYLASQDEQQKEVDNLLHEKQKLADEHQKAQKALTDCDVKLIELNRKLTKTSESIAVDSARLKMCKNIAENFDAFSGGVKVLLKESQENKNLASKIVGVVGNMIKVPKQYEVALETTLGSALQNIVTKNEDDAKSLISYLKENKGGRVTFLPKTSVRERNLDDERILSDNGVFGTALQLVEYDKEYHNVFSSLMGSTVIVDNLETAVSLSKKYSYKYRIVTLDGDMIVPQGSISGGSRKQSSSNVLSIDREIKEIEEKIERISCDKQKLQQLVDQLSNAKQDLLTKIKNLTDKKGVCDVSLATAKERLAKTSEFAQSEKETLERLEKEKVDTKTRIDQINTALEMMAQNIKELSDKKSDTQSSVSDGQDEYTVLKKQQDELNDKITDVKVKLSTLTANIENTEKEIETSNTLLTQNQALIGINSHQILENKQEISLLEADMQMVAAQDLTYFDLEEVKKRLLANEQDKIKAKEDFERADKDKTDFAQQENVLKEKLLRQEFELESIETNLAALTNTVWEDYGLTYSNALQYKDENYDPTDAQKVITKLKNQRAHLGPVNVMAVDSYSETYQRYSEIQEQMDDLKKAESDLNVVIKDLTKEMVAKFNAGFEEINKNFSYTFKELFKGGHARLVIEPNPDKEEIDYGIEIEAQPPGKKLQNISLLSGGERTLTVAAILFAIIKAKPMPFCLLDEIEAALDEANADRIARFLRKFSENTQFIVITHKKPTMESADVLYGVTMEEKGVSKIVSVKLTEAIKHVGD